ncbi:MAG: HlyD family type I secretion periplasmic adaptor subunit [Geminicoccaceae bacterium]|nr:HlyD family type I secretion periplasmic adaptor subunit [Geminicoccaceae bacterium]
MKRMFPERRPPAGRKVATLADTRAGGQEVVPRRPTAPPSLPEREVARRPPVGGWVVFGTVVAGVFFGGFGAWAMLAPIASAAVAHGYVVVESSRKTIQHLEGGIVQEIKVKEGDTVQAGDLLLTLVPIQAQAKRDALKRELINLWAAEARLKALLSGAAEPAFPPQLAERKDDPLVGDILRAQEELFTIARTSIEGQVSVLEQRVDQMGSQIKGIEQLITGYNQQLRTLGQQRKDTEYLVEQRLTRKSDLLTLDREIANLNAQRGSDTARIEQVRQAIGETRMQIIAAKDDFRDKQAKELDEVRSRGAEIEQSYKAAQDVLERQEVRAPVTGTIVDLKYHTNGGVVGPGQPIMEIVPSGDRMMIEARISPLDIDEVYPGLPVNVRLTAFRMRTTPTLDGKLVTVSADQLQDERTGTPYYKGMVELPPESFKGLPPTIKLYPGMPADAMIKLHDRTFVDYILGPFEQSIHRAFRES